MVNDALKDEFAAGLHALAIEARAPQARGRQEP
jgi:stress-induced morphogen